MKETVKAHVKEQIQGRRLNFVFWYMANIAKT